MTDSAASKRLLLRYRTCAACGHPATNAHHILPRSQGGDDVEQCLAPLCGTGAARCHGAIHGNPYTVGSPTAYLLGTAARQIAGQPLDSRRDAEWVARRLGAWVLAHPDRIAYVTAKLGVLPGLDYLRRTLYVSPVAAYLALRDHAA